MINTALERVDAEIERHRTRVSMLHAELEDLDDYLDVLAARRQAMHKRTHTQAEMELRYRVKSRRRTA